MAKGTFGFANYRVLVKISYPTRSGCREEKRIQMIHVYLNRACRFLSSCMVIHVLARLWLLVVHSAADYNVVIFKVSQKGVL